MITHDKNILFGYNHSVSAQIFCHLFDSLKKETYFPKMTKQESAENDNLQTLHFIFERNDGSITILFSSIAFPFIKAY